jgi:hypothetical protein
MLSVVLVTGIFAAGLPLHDRRTETPPVTPPSVCAACGNPNASSWGRPSQPQPSSRKCPEDSSMATVQSGVQYCIPDHVIGQ